MNRSLLSAAIAAVVASVAVAPAFADDAKHRVIGHGNYGHSNHGFVRPYVAPAPIVVNRFHHNNHNSHGYRGHGHNGYNNGYNGGYNHGHNGHWRNGRWIAPVVIGAAVLGTLASAHNYYVPPTVTYVNPAPTYIAPVLHAPYGNDVFSVADRDRNGFIDKWEAGYDRNWERWFYDIDSNRDGYLSRAEVGAWGGVRY